MASGVEVRVPYLDHELVELLYRIPIRTLLSGGLTKSLLRTLAERQTGRAPQPAPKMYVAAPQREWIKGPWREKIREMIQDSILARRGYIVKEKLLRQFEVYADSLELGNSFFVWKFINLELWYRAFIQSSAPVGAASLNQEG